MSPDLLPPPDERVFILPDEAISPADYYRWKSRVRLAEALAREKERLIRKLRGEPHDKNKHNQK